MGLEISTCPTLLSRVECARAHNSVWQTISSANRCTDGEGSLTPEAFAEHLTGWISPSCVSRAIERLEEDPDGALASSEMHLLSPVLESPGEAEFLPMVTDFLSHFRFTPDLVRLIEILTGKPFSKSSREFLLKLYFCGSVFEAQGRSATKARELLVVTERDIVADLLLTPLRMLTWLHHRLCQALEGRQGERHPHFPNALGEWGLCSRSRDQSGSRLRLRFDWWI